MNDLALHMKNLEIFFNLYIPSLTDMQRAVLKKCLVELYSQFGITWETDVSKLGAKDFPIFSDLYKLAEEKAATAQDRQVYADLALLICDEAYLMKDQKVPQSLVYLRNVMKRARKYEGALGIISHSVIEFLSESIKQYGQALLDIPCYKLLMGELELGKPRTMTEQYKNLLNFRLKIKKVTMTIVFYVWLKESIVTTN